MAHFTSRHGQFVTVAIVRHTGSTKNNAKCNSSSHLQISTYESWRAIMAAIGTAIALSRVVCLEAQRLAKVNRGWNRRGSA
jgi:hypothetical protein